MGSQTVFIVFSGILFFFAAVLVYQARKQLRLANMCELATEMKPGEARFYHGKLVRVAGEAMPVGEEVLTAPISQKACVYWKYEILQRVRRNDKTRTRRIAAGESKAPFLLRDATGQLWIEPQNVQINDIEPSAVYTFLPETHPIFGGFMRRRTYANEWNIPLYATIYAIGTVIHHPDGSAYLVPGNTMAAVTMLPFKQFIRKRRLWGFAMIVGALACIMGGIYLL